MKDNIFWDRKISKEKAGIILEDPEHQKFMEIAATLLSRTSDIKLVFSEYISKEIFCGNWRGIKNQMRKNKWNDERIDYWSEVFKVLRKKKDYTAEEKRKPSTIRDLVRISEILKSHRKKLGLTQMDLAKKTGLAQQTISYIENGTGDFSFRTFTKLANALNIDLMIAEGGLGADTVWSSTSGNVKL